MEHLNEWFRRNERKPNPTAIEKFRNGILENARAGRFEQAGLDLLNANYPGLAHAFLERIKHSRATEALQKMKGLRGSANIKAADLSGSKEESAFQKLVELHIRLGNVEKAQQMANEKGCGGDTIQHVAWAVKLMNIAQTITLPAP